MTASYKFPPRYSNQLLRKTKVDPIFVTCDPRCLNYIQNLRGICLFCETQNSCSQIQF
jgi:hypothetical protein